MMRQKIVVVQEGRPLPSAATAPADTPLALGGGLSVERLLEAYRGGIFPWELYQGFPVWWSPDPRFVLFPEELRVPKSLERVIRSGRFEVTFNREFRAVMEGCRDAERPGQDGTWIAPEMIEAYCRLHEAGHALSVEVWRAGALVGGLYGVRIGRVFAGESMFALEADASKAGFATLVRKLRDEGCLLVDCQVYTEHLARFGAHEIPRREFLRLLGGAVAGASASGAEFDVRAGCQSQEGAL